MIRIGDIVYSPYDYGGLVITKHISKLGASIITTKQKPSHNYAINHYEDTLTINFYMTFINTFILEYEES